MARLLRRLLRDLCLVPAAAVLVYGLVVSLPLPTDADARQPQLRSVARQLRDDLGVGQPLGFLRPWEKLVRGERLGSGARSTTGPELLQALRTSLSLGGLALLLALGLALGFAALRLGAAGGPAEAAVELLPAAVQGSPPFLLALVAAMALLRADHPPPLELAAALVLAAWPASFLGVVLSDALRAERARPYALAARARGRGPAGVLLLHALPNALPAVLDALAPVATSLLAGSFAVETLFGLPGFGLLYVDAARERQVALVVVATAAFAAILVAVGFAVELLRLVLDPRARGRTGAEAGR